MLAEQTGHLLVQLTDLLLDELQPSSVIFTSRR
jgi:hypothetical protein